MKELALGLKDEGEKMMIFVMVMMVAGCLHPLAMMVIHIV